MTKTCDICGEPFEAKFNKQHICFGRECRNAYYRQIQAEYRKRHGIDEDDYKPHVPKPDTIVAIGYAERQMAQTLEMVGKVKV